MRGLENRIEKLEGVYKPQRQPRPSLVMLHENDEPVNKHYTEVLRLAQEAEGGGEDVCLTVLRIPAGTKIRERFDLLVPKSQPFDFSTDIIYYCKCYTR